MFQVRSMLLLASTEAEVPVTNIGLPMSARIRPYCCMAWAMIWASGPMLAIKALTAGVFCETQAAPERQVVGARTNR